MLFKKKCRIVFIIIPAVILIAFSGCTSKITTPHAEENDMELIITLSSNTYQISSDSVLQLKIELVNIANHDVKISEYYSSEIAVRLIVNETEFVMQRTMPIVIESELIVVKSDESVEFTLDLVGAKFFPVDNNLNPIEFPMLGSNEFYCLSQWSNESNHVFCKVTE